MVSTPTFSPAGGTYTSAQSVTLSDATSGATIYYTTNGTTPTTSSTVYTGPITVSSTETLEAIAVATGDTNSGVASAAYTITATVAMPAFSLGSGTYSTAQSVAISDATSGATIYYTTNGTTPTTSSARYTGPITVSSTETLQAMAAATADTNSAVASATYTIIATVATPTFSPGGGTYSTAQSVTISDATSGATIYYTTNGTTPTTSSTQYTGPITVNSTETLQAIAAATGDTNSAVASAAYTITAHGRNAGLLTRRRDLYLCAVGDPLRCHLRRNHLLHDQRKYAYYVLDRVHRPHYGELDGDAGGDRGSHGRHQQRGRVRSLHHHACGRHADLLTCRRDLYLRAVGDHLRCHLGRNHLLHDQRNYAYHVLDQVHRPHHGELDGDAAGYGGSHGRHQQRGRLCCLHHKRACGLHADLLSRRRDLYFRAVGDPLRCHLGRNHLLHDQRNTPTTSSTVYTGPITVNSTETLQAMAAATGDTNSAVASAAYTINLPVVSTPTFSPAAGTYTSAQSVTISDATSGATIYYTTNGSTPTTSSAVYTGPITVSSTETLQAIAAATGDTNSAVASAAYTITPTVSTPTFSPAAGSYTSAQSVTISDATSGATIYYTTNGTDAYHVLDRVRRPHYGQLDGDAGGNRGSTRATPTARSRPLPTP